MHFAPIPDRLISREAAAGWLATVLGTTLVLFHATTAVGGWATGPAFQRQLARQVSVVWSDSPLRLALDGLSRSQDVAIVLDRRVDPGRKLSLSVSDVALETLLQTVAQQCGLDMAQFGSVIYLGPPNSASRLSALVASREKGLRNMPATAARVYRQSRAMAWDSLAEPRNLLADLASDNQLDIAGLDRVPHDLWPALELPSMSLLERLTLIANQFDLTFDIAPKGREITLTPIPDDLDNPERNLPSSEAISQSPTQSPPTKRSSSNVSDKSLSKPSGAKTHEGRSASSSAPAKSSATAADRSKKTPPSLSAGGPSADIDQMRIERLAVREQPIGPVLRQLTERLKLDLQIDEKALAEAGISLDQRVSVTVENVTVDDLFRALLKSTKLTFRRTQKTIAVVPAD